MDMGNFLYRPTPRRTHKTEEGQYTFYDYGASQITGWRHKQEDRYICLPRFFEDLSLFAVYDGHGGEQVVQYLQRYLHQHIFNELVLHEDPELALYLGFVTCDNSLRTISDKEFAVIQDDLDLEFEVADREERREVIFGLKNLISNDSAGASKGDSSSSGIKKDGATTATAAKDNTTAPGTSKGSSNPDLDELRAEVFSTCLNQLPSIFFLTQAPIEKEDESDEEYEPQKDNIKHDIFEISSENDEGSTESEDSEDDEEEEDAEREEGSAIEEDDESAEMDFEESANKEGDECAKNKHAKQSKNCDEKSNEDKNQGDVKKSKTANHSVCSKDESFPSQSLENKGTRKEQIEAAISAALNKRNSDFAVACGSTATVLLLNEKKLYLANVGDSRCVACINGQAVDISVDHKPMNPEEHARIINAGGTVSEDHRVNGFLDMSRAFGDFGFKQKKVAEPFQILSCEPYITTIDVTSDLEFIIIASDGIWNTMESSEVINYLKSRMQDTKMELRDICGEMFEEMLPSQVTADGSGCDNMTAILIQFKSFNKVSSTAPIGFQECYKYFYPPQHRKKYFMPETDTSARQKDILPDQNSEELKPQSKEVASSPSNTENLREQLNPSDNHYDEQRENPMELIQLRSPSSDDDGRENFQPQCRIPQSSQIPEDHYQQLYPRNYTYDDRHRANLMEPRQESYPFSDSLYLNNYDGYPYTCIKHYEQLWAVIQSLKEKLDNVNRDLSVIKHEVENVILKCLNPKYNPHAPSTSGNHPSAPSSSGNHANVPSTSGIHLNQPSTSGIRPHIPSTSGIHPNIAPNPNISMVNLGAFFGNHIFKPVPYEMGSRSPSEQESAQSGSGGSQSAAGEEEIPLIDLASDDSTEVVVDNKEAAEIETEPAPAEAIERSAGDVDDPDEVSKKIKSPDYTNINVEKHK